MGLRESVNHIGCVLLGQTYGDGRHLKHQCIYLALRGRFQIAAPSGSTCRALHFAIFFRSLYTESGTAAGSHGIMVFRLYPLLWYTVSTCSA